MHLARMLKDAGGVPAYGNQRSEWDAGCRFDFDEPGVPMTGATLRGVVTSRTDDAIVAGVRSGDEAVFAQLLNDWSRSMLLLARTFVSTDASAEEVVQDTWLAVIRGIDRFEGRSSLRTWVYRILVNTAKKRGVRESRTVPWSSLPRRGGPRPDGRPGAVPRTPTTSTPAAGGRSRRSGSSAEGSVLAGEVRGHDPRRRSTRCPTGNAS